MKLPASRALPALLVAIVIGIAALAPSLRARAGASAPGLPRCGDTSLPPADAQLPLAAGNGIMQPFELTTPVQGCSLGVVFNDYAFSSNVATASIVAWDPLVLAPDPAFVALRSRSLYLSGPIYTIMTTSFERLVTSAVSAVAEPVPPTLAVNYLDAGFYHTYRQSAQFWTNSPIDLPPGMYYVAGTQPVPLPGAHPVVAMRFCEVPADSSLRVLQSVGRSTEVLGAEPYEVLQRFRIPHRGTLDWVELAYGAILATPYGQVAVLDGSDMPQPAELLPSPLYQADNRVAGVPLPTWSPSLPGAASVVLEPEHDYWLLVRTSNAYSLTARAVTGSEGPDFTSRIGPLYSRTTPSGSWQERPGLALSFRLIGEPDPATLAVPPTVGPAGLRLATEPNPARGAAMLRWSGARGAVRLEVMDARGRRVASHEAAGEEGSWLWRGVGDAGTPAAAGVYFLRATDGEGTVGLARVTLVR